MYVEYSSSHLLGAGGSVVAVAVNVIGGTAYERGGGDCVSISFMDTVV